MKFERLFFTLARSDEAGHVWNTLTSLPNEWAGTNEGILSLISQRQEKADRERADARREFATEVRRCRTIHRNDGMKPSFQNVVRALEWVRIPKTFDERFANYVRELY